MRFLELHLKPYGPFENLELCFDGPRSALQLIYGDNEAGKSTTLRAITGLLYGIPKQTHDAHRFEMPKLRIGAVIEDGSGKRLSFLRRKGNKSTLLDFSGKELPDGLLAPYLGGLPEGGFKQIFGLSYEGLQAGGQALLEGQGELGESLFAAGLGDASLRRALTELADRAEAIFSRRATKRPLNQALSEFEQSRKKVRERSLSARAWQEERKALEQSEQEASRCHSRAAELRAELRRLEQRRRCLPHLARWREAEQALAALPAAPRLPKDARERRLATQARLDELEAQLQDTQIESRRLTERVAELAGAEGLREAAEIVAGLNEDFGIHKKSKQDRVRVAAQARQVEADIQAVLRRLGPELGLKDAESMRLDSGLEARIKALVKKRQVLDERLAAAATQRKKLEAKIEQEGEVLAAPEPEALQSLRAALTVVRDSGRVDAIIKEARLRLAELRRAAEQQLASLRGWSGSLQDCARLPVPGLEAVRAALEDFEKLRRRDEELERQSQELEARRERLRAELRRMQAQGAVPTEDELNAARATRARLWDELRRSLDASRAGEPRGHSSIRRLSAELRHARRPAETRE